MVTLLRTLLELDGFAVAHAGRGAMVLPMARSEKPDVVFMDVHLADADGLELLKQMRADPELGKMRVIMTSGLDVSQECEQAGCNAFILKPYPPDQLASTIKKVLES